MQSLEQSLRELRRAAPRRLKKCANDCGYYVAEPTCGSSTEELRSVCFDLVQAISFQPGLRAAHQAWAEENERRLQLKQRLLAGDPL